MPYDRRTKRQLVKELERLQAELARLEQALQRSEERLRELMTRERRACEAEGTAVARDLHDELGQVLTSLRLDLDAMGEALPSGSEALAGKLEAAGALAERLIAAVREIAVRLRPPMLQTVGLAGAIEWLVSHFGPRAGVREALDRV